MTALRGIVFDKDGTLYDFNATWGTWTMGLLEQEARGDAALVEALAEILGYDTARRRFRKDSVVVAGTTDEVAAAILPLLPWRERAKLVSDLNDRAAMAPQVEAADLADLLGRLRARGLSVGVATNDSEAPARAHLAASGLLEALDFVAGYDSGHGAKPGPGQLLAFCAARGLDPAECLMVGDSAHDLLAGRAAGMRVLGVLTGLAERADLAPLADDVIDTIADLETWLDRSAG